jgi:hypothetical protein
MCDGLPRTRDFSELCRVRTVDPSPVVTELGARSFRATFDFVAVATPERKVISTWHRRVAPDPHPTSRSNTGTHRRTELGSNGASYQNLSAEAFERDCKALLAGATPQDE